MFINPFTAEDAIWHPGEITHLGITLWTHYNFHRAFQQLMHLLQKGHTTMGPVTRITWYFADYCTLVM